MGVSSGSMTGAAVLILYWVHHFIFKRINKSAYTNGDNNDNNANVFVYAFGLVFLNFLLCDLLGIWTCDISVNYIIDTQRNGVIYSTENNSLYNTQSGGCNEINHRWIVEWVFLFFFMIYHFVVHEYCNIEMKWCCV